MLRAAVTDPHRTFPPPRHEPAPFRRLARKLRGLAYYYGIDRPARARGLGLLRDAWLARELASGGVSAREAELALGLETAIHPDDEMFYASEAEHYLVAGLGALRSVEAALEAAGITTDVASVLDLPCGYGRVLRWLKARFPAAELVGCELQAEAVTFCRERLGVDARRSAADLGSLDLGRGFGLQWCGSLFTHLDRSRALALLRCLVRHLEPGGLCVLTTHGQAVDDLLRLGIRDYDLEPPAIAGLLEDFDATGFGYAEYAFWPGYGVSLTSAEAVRRLATVAAEQEGCRWTEVLHRPLGWDGHQDVFAFRRQD
ncbi:MAG: class I SAM-dependent methyltransferase [Holophagales bacterium]|nr:class I SAM-dependent methyltransferase [Holophagales bacterium]